MTRESATKRRTHLDPQKLLDLSLHLSLLLLLSERLKQLQLLEVPRSLVRSEGLKSEDSEELLLLDLLLVGERLLLMLLLVPSTSSSPIASTHPHSHLSTSVGIPLHPSSSTTTTSSSHLPSRHHSSSSSLLLLLTLVRVLPSVQSSHLGYHLLVPGKKKEGMRISFEVAANEEEERGRRKETGELTRRRRRRRDPGCARTKGIAGDVEEYEEGVEERIPGWSCCWGRLVQRSLREEGGSDL